MLEEYVCNWGKIRLAVPRDSHCILHAFIEIGINNTIEELVPKNKERNHGDH